MSNRRGPSSPVVLLVLDGWGYREGRDGNAIELARTDWRLTLLLFSFLPFIFGAAAGFRALARRVTRRGMQAMADVNATVKETISGISVAKGEKHQHSCGVQSPGDFAGRFRRDLSGFCGGDRHEHHHRQDYS